MNNRRYGIIGNNDQYRTLGSFASYTIAKWYGDSEFGPLGYRIVIL